MSFQLEDESWVKRDFGLDRRLIKALSKMGMTYPTLVQAKTIPLALAGKDVLVRAKTGSGKTISFALPILHKLLSTSEPSCIGIKSIVLAPTKELCKQIEKCIMDLIYYCKDSVTCCSLSDDNHVVQQHRLRSKPNIVIATPARIVHHLKTNAMDLSGVDMLVIDEADLILSFGYSEDIQFITTKLPKIVQGLLMSATLSPELDKFKKIVLNNPAILKLEETKGVGHLQQFYLDISENDKFLVLYVFLKLGLLQGKGLIFVNDINKCYRLKLFLQQFFINSAVLNAQVPFNSRVHIIEEFNRGAYDYLIATDAGVDDGEVDAKEDVNDDEEDDNAVGDGDEQEVDGAEELDGVEENFDQGDSDEESFGEGDGGEGEGDDEMDDEENNENDDESNDNEEEEVEEEHDLQEEHPQTKHSGKADRRKASRDEDESYGVSRGIDFNGVGFVINFDFPVTAAAYTHRVGRTARGGASGTSLSFVTRSSGASKGKDVDVSERDATMLAQVRMQQPRLSIADGDNVLGAMAGYGDEESLMQPAPLVFNLKELDSFRYRVEDTLKSVTVVAVKELRTAEIKREILNSAKLRTFFANNPNDLKALRHDKAIAHPIRQKDHLKHVPEYLIPVSMRSMVSVRGKKKKRRANKVSSSQEQRVKKSKMNDPLMQPQGSQNEAEGPIDIDDGADDADDAGETEQRVYTEKEVLGRSSSGRNQWKAKHKKGKFNPKTAKKNTHRVAGSFMKSKPFKG